MLINRLRTWWQAQTRAAELVPLRLSFDLDMDADGRHTIRTFRVNAEGTRCPIDDPRPFARYGYVETDDAGTYFIDEEQRQVLAAVMSLDPHFSADGRLRFDITPGVLRFLRTRIDVRESQSSRQVRFARRSLSLLARVGYNPASGILRVATGYATQDAPDRLIPSEHLAYMQDGYVRSGNLFIPAPLPDQWTPWVVGEPVRDIPRERIPQFITTILPALEKDFRLVKTPKAARIRVYSDAPRAVVRVEKQDPGELHFDLGFRYPDGRFLTCQEMAWVLDGQPCGDAYQIDDYTWSPLDPLAVRSFWRRAQALPEVARDLDGSFHLPLMRFVTLEESISESGAAAMRGPAYQQFLDELSGFESHDHYVLPGQIESDLAAQQVNLRPYQRSGIYWLRWLASNALHGILADDMGLGKTLQTCCALRLAYEAENAQKPSLIIAPKSVLKSWTREIQRCFPQMPVVLYHGQERKDIQLDAGQRCVLITTYETAANDLNRLKHIPFFYIILDEATKIKNHDTARARAVRALNGVHRLAISGTPVENRPSELWSIFAFLMPSYLGLFGTFKTLFEEPILNGDFTAADRLGKRIRPFLLRRKKGDVAKDLPEKIVLEEWVEMTAEQKKLYAAAGDEMAEVRRALERGEKVSYAGCILPLLTRLKQICDHPALVTKDPKMVLGRSEKFDRLVEMLREIVEGGEQAVVFSHFLGMLSLFERAMKEAGIPYIRIDGSTDDRQSLIDRFNRHEAKVGLLSLQATGYGITMTAGNHVLHADRWWNPAIEAQATDRVHRIGQEKTVYVRHVLVSGSIEERIAQILAAKAEMVDSIMGAAKQGGHKWSRGELLELLRPF